MQGNDLSGKSHFLKRVSFSIAMPIPVPVRADLSSEFCYQYSFSLPLVQLAHLGLSLLGNVTASFKILKA